MMEKDRAMIEHLEQVVKQLALERAMILKTKVMSEEEVTEFINEKGEKYAKKYARMNPLAIILEMVVDMTSHLEEVEDERE